ncbi:MAG: hypothetical protein IT348_04255 [Candidatus Eisenbacteria bacterium]|nr:hypothetical protein [Candidatus Eisenbacteria bacterium]
MLGIAIKHFVVVGLLFALAVGWALTAVVNTLIGNAVVLALGERAEDAYGFALALTLISMALIGGSAIAGNRVFRSRVSQAPMAGRSLALSTALFLLVVLAFVAPEMDELLRLFASNTRATYRNPGTAWLMLSLPLLRLLGLPLIYVLAAGSKHAARPVETQAIAA